MQPVLYLQLERLVDGVVVGVRKFQERRLFVGTLCILHLPLLVPLLGSLRAPYHHRQHWLVTDAGLEYLRLVFWYVVRGLLLQLATRYGLRRTAVPVVD